MDIFEEGVRREYEPRKGGGRVARTSFENLKYKKDPKFLAAYNLNKALERFPAFTSDARSLLQNEFTELPDLPTTNLNLLASVLDFLRKYPNPKPKHFTYEILKPYFFEFLIEKMSKDEREQYFIRFKAYFLKYLVIVNQYRS